MVTPQGVQELFGAASAAAQADEATAQADEATAKADEATAKADEATAKADEATAKADEATANPDEATANPDEATADPRPKKRARKASTVSYLNSSLCTLAKLETDKQFLNSGSIQEPDPCGYGR